MQNIKNLIQNISTSAGAMNVQSQSGAIGSGAIGSGAIGSSAGINGSYGLFAQEKEQSYVKRYEIIEIPEDLLALSVCWKRLRDSGQSQHIGKLLDKVLFEKVTQHDKDTAATIRDYYSKKIMMLKLKSIPLTNFRTDLNEFIHGEGKKFKDNIQPLVYRLPEFYEYDIVFDEFAGKYNHNVVGLSQRSILTVKSLSLVEKLKVSTSRNRRIEYWLNDTDDNLVCLMFDLNNPLITLLDKKLCEESISVSGIFYKKERDGKEYLKLDKYSFV